MCKRKVKGKEGRASFFIFIAASHRAVLLQKKGELAGDTPERSLQYKFNVGFKS
jgi:hypothetical protein